MNHFLSTTIASSIGIGLSLSSYANDPFDKTQRQILSAEISATTETAACHQNQEAIFPDTPFKQLNIVGILKHKDQTQLFIAEGKAVHIAKIGQLVGQERLKIDKIERQQITLLRWASQDCKASHPVTIKF